MLEEANKFFMTILEGKEWDRFDESDKTRALGTATLQIKQYKFKKSHYLELADVKQAIFYQALYLLLNEDRLDYEIGEMNGIGSMGTSGFSVSRSNMKTLCHISRQLISSHIVRSFEVIAW